MSYTVTSESFKSLSALYGDPGLRLKWEPLFVIPVWLEVWWRVFGGNRDLSVCAVRQDNELIGIAPLMVNDGSASIIGSADVCDYMDFVVLPGREREFFNLTLDYLKKTGISTLDLQSLRPDSTILTWLTDLAKSRGCKVDVTQVDVTLELGLPPTWDEYLGILNTKQRHEVKRKLRRLEEAGEISYRSFSGSEAVNSAFDAFIEMFTESRTDKADYLTEKRLAFFRAMADAMSGAGILRLGVLEIQSLPAAMIMYFDFNNTIYLYNSGYKPEYVNLSAGLMSKVLCIRESIESGRKVFDFLKGSEVYKSRLGGVEIPLYDCRIKIR